MEESSGTALHAESILSLRHDVGSSYDNIFHLASPIDKRAKDGCCHEEALEVTTKVGYCL